ncbi:uncharacterized protein GGS22DRAFT_9506 [Annulohypoxylon maeteangense]|uniref:uncharacterized protein n=1 Tax=Annulohypoxylon maeteangense TaxID=1927788 RepID=UPI002007FF17|nr:uncharacterized protein GGS22DRAFT_9506 [Annulohypoxylon maeteangense]KAI0890199.1 hypothetical protein GGS22DRAFT_9506 [Annulohypoxylon maeteangense]
MLAPPSDRESRYLVSFLLLSGYCAGATHEIAIQTRPTACAKQIADLEIHYTYGETDAQKKNKKTGRQRAMTISPVSKGSIRLIQLGLSTNPRTLTV